MFTLASQSPRRIELLRELHLEFDCKTAQINEQALLETNKNISFHDLVKKLAMAKAWEVFEREDQHYPVLAADTIVILNNKILGKPENGQDAKRMLIQLCGQYHEVLTGVSMIDEQGETAFVSASRVKFRPFNPQVEDIIDASIRSGSALDKAGAYGIQEFGKLLVEKIDGDFYSIMGLPIAQVYALLYEKEWIS